ncbi:lysis protein [Klebsiella quasipneumoniae]|uniref:lysis protein n=1 Tax=Klebsiella quasipneumoniae TaxID=1463165 RepID=UPI0012513985|nr:lysis protein [Klebsiella quasipneumoniae]HDU5304716.1 lysis protein [Klebsiella quasipneumoniae subsp. similipneumoniae]EIY5063462.1 lysis protein [Klebsiella quasipneumoniae]EIY5067940.1 lysis protein [Klebsiella quasipneumoniae]VAP80915.1 bacteriophage lysis protein [Klebsiella quasipneumoniae]VAP86952.1 bacteriophage lysis protein [Klebsiella quasipneumoniae]
MNRLIAVICAVLICLIVSFGWLASHYHDNANEFKRQRDKATEQLSLAKDSITDVQTRQRDVAALDAKYTKELADAKSQLEDLQRCVSSGKCGLRVNARCPKNGASGAGGVGDASGPRLTADAERDYWRLRAGIITTTGQVNYLQDYIRKQCLK